MKLKYITTSLLLVATMSLTNCTKDLETFPLDKNVTTAGDAYATAQGYTRALNKIYSVWALSGQGDMSSSDVQDVDGGHSAMVRSWFNVQENSTDLAKCAFTGGGDIYAVPINKLNWGTAKNQAFDGVYYRMMYVVSLVNDFLKYIDNAPAEIDKVQYEAEARFCRALAYYALMDVFGYPPFITEDNYSVNPSQISRPELFNWIESELFAVRDVLPDAKVYGRANKSVVNALLARMYLNAEVYTGTARYADCITACEAVFTAGYELADKYAELFMANNGENPDANKEIIFPVMFDGASAQSWSMTILLHGARPSNIPQDEAAATGINGGWGGYRGVGNLVRSFQFESSSENAWTPQTIRDSRGMFDNRNGQTIDITTTASGTFDAEGWSVFKYSNMGSDGVTGKDAVAADTDYILFRLADVYLMHAEAVARTNGNLSVAVENINKLRRRGYDPDNNNLPAPDTYEIDAAWLTANASIGGTSSTVAYGNILNERARELYWEGTRRTDLIRYGLFTSGDYVWAEKGSVITGVGVDDRYNLYPIPVADLSANSSLEQNSGYGNAN